MPNISQVFNFGAPNAQQVVQTQVLDSTFTPLADWSAVNVHESGAGQYVQVFSLPDGFVGFVRARLQSSPTAIDTYPVNLSGLAGSVISPPSSGVAGSYNPDGSSPFYCAVADVASCGMMVKWEKLQLWIDKYKVMLPSGVTDVPSYIAQMLIPAAESEIDTYCRGTYKPTVQTEYFDGDGGVELHLPSYPVLAINYCKIYALPSVPFVELTAFAPVRSAGNLGDSTDYANAQLLFDPTTGRVEIPPRVLYAEGWSIPMWNYTFIPGQKNVEISWTYGFSDPTAVPNAFKRACALRVVIKALEAIGGMDNDGLAASQIGDSHRTTGREKNLPFGDLIARYDAEIVKLLVNYKRFA